MQYAIKLTMWLIELGGGVGKALSMDHDHDSLELAHRQWSKFTNFDYLTTEIRKFWLWEK